MTLFKHEDFNHMSNKWEQRRKKKKGGIVVRLSWYMLETMGERIAKILGKRRKHK